VSKYLCPGRYSISDGITTVKWPLKLYVGLLGFAQTQAFILHKHFQSNKPNKQLHWDFLLRLQEQMVGYTDHMLFDFLIARTRLRMGIVIAKPPVAPPELKVRSIA
jgi:hypothetical protein